MPDDMENGNHPHGDPDLDMPKQYVERQRNIDIEVNSQDQKQPEYG
ncbi:MAG: hypothetical protein GY834_05245 [Bacteroidetes bacterium]|nr:hypothetical protein [Bacteroidota bacterium]